MCIVMQYQSGWMMLSYSSFFVFFFFAVSSLPSMTDRLESIARQNLYDSLSI